MCRPFDLRSRFLPASNGTANSPVVPQSKDHQRPLCPYSEGISATLQKYPCSPVRVQPGQNSIATVQTLNSHRYQAPVSRRLRGRWCLWGRSDVLVLPSSSRTLNISCVCPYALQTRRSLQSHIADNCQARAYLFCPTFAFPIARAPVPLAVARLNKQGIEPIRDKGGSD